MNCPMTNTIWGLIGILVGGLIGHWLAGVRDSATRKRRFCAFLSQWKGNHSIPSRSATQIGTAVDKNVLIYDEMLSKFRPEIEHVRDIWGDNKDFVSLCS